MVLQAEPVAMAIAPLVRNSTDGRSSGAIFGDHCSPMSDTTVLASTASASDHLDHVRTQTPYALVAMAAALFLGYLPCGFSGHQPFLALALASAAVIAVLWIFGKRVPSPEAPTPL